MSKLCRRTHFLMRLYSRPSLTRTQWDRPLFGYAKCSDMQKQACMDIAYTSSPISGTSSLTLCKWQTWSQLNFSSFPFTSNYLSHSNCLNTQNLLIAPAVVRDMTTPYPDSQSRPVRMEKRKRELETFFDKIF